MGYIYKVEHVLRRVRRVNPPFPRRCGAGNTSDHVTNDSDDYPKEADLNMRRRTARSIAPLAANF